MLNTLLKIGEWQSEGKSEWDRFLEFPEVKLKDGRGNPIKNYTLSIIFDLDDQKVVVDQDNLKEYDPSDVQRTLPVKLKSSGSKKISAAGSGSRLNYLYTAFFGDINKDANSGHLFEAIENDYPDLLQDNFKEILQEVFSLENKFKEKTTRNGQKKVDIKSIEESFKLGSNEKIVFLICKIKSSEHGFENPILFSEIIPYKKFLKYMYFPDSQKADENQTQKLCYASGMLMEDVQELNLTERYSLNKMFVTTTQNYAQEWNKENFPKNYQVSLKYQNHLDYASHFLLNKGFRVSIADIPHVIIPQFQENTKVDLEMALEGIQRKSDLLFNFNRLDYLSKMIEDEIEENDIYWLNFIAYESDGNFFKSTEVIKDVSSFHYNKLLNTFFEINNQFEKYSFVNWESVMKEYNEPRSLNFNTLYQVIPLRKDKEKKNKALDLFKTILENRNVNKKILYDYFTELILCHYYERYNSYTNVRQYGKNNFYFAVRDSVFKYLAFFEFLKKLNFIDMEEQTNPMNDPIQYDQLEKDFFNKMSFTQEQRAMFYLGRMLNSVEYLQHGKNMTVIQKVNFNGMDKDSIQRLRIDLIEKAKQYNAMNRVVFTDQKFGNEFDYNNWTLSPQEAIFFMLTGYSFRAGRKVEANNNDNE